MVFYKLKVTLCYEVAYEEEFETIKSFEFLLKLEFRMGTFVVLSKDPLQGGELVFYDL